MILCMAGLDYQQSSISQREKLSFTKSGVMDMDRTISGFPGIHGAVLLSTCNRTELYLSCQEPKDPGRLLCQGAGARYEEFSGVLITRQGEDCVRHLFEVACGLQSQILGEDQILTQVKTALALAREAGTADADLETLFRTAAACGKAAKSGGRLAESGASAAHQAVKAMEQRLGKLEGLRAMVIGNGEMGKLAASLLRQEGCEVTVTLRTYRHGETVIPAGCRSVGYEDRYGAMEGFDILLSATTSPHYTLTLEAFLQVRQKPAFLVDLAIPRDIQPEIGEIPGISLLNMDNLGRTKGVDEKELDRVQNLMERYLENFRQWSAFRASIPAQQEVKTAVWERVSHYVTPEMDSREAARIAAEKTVELLAGGLKEHLEPESWYACAEKIRAHTR